MILAVSLRGLPQIQEMQCMVHRGFHLEVAVTQSEVTHGLIFLAEIPMHAVTQEICTDKIPDSLWTPEKPDLTPGPP